MALSEDQKAMLRLLAQREQGYDDLAALMGLSVEEVRAKVTEALAEVEAEGAAAPDVPPEPEPVPEPPAEPAPEPAAAETPPPPEPAPPEPRASEEEPRQPAAEKPRQPAGKAPARPGAPKLSLPKDRGVQAAIGAGLLVVIAIVVILIVGGSGGSGGSGESASAGSGSDVSSAEGQQLTGAALTPVDGGEGEGRAIFGRVKKNVVLQVEATGLKPSPKGSSYAIWLYKSPKLALRVGAVRVGSNGGLAVQLPIPNELLGYVAAGAFDQIDVSRTGDAEYAAEVAKSKREKRLPEHVGTSVLRGEITGPMIEAAAKAGK